MTSRVAMTKLLKSRSEVEVSTVLLWSQALPNGDGPEKGGCRHPNNRVTIYCLPIVYVVFVVSEVSSEHLSMPLHQSKH